jgi:hypothetical protein
MWDEKATPRAPWVKRHTKKSYTKLQLFSNFYFSFFKNLWSAVLNFSDEVILILICRSRSKRLAFWRLSIASPSGSHVLLMWQAVYFGVPMNYEVCTRIHFLVRHIRNRWTWGWTQEWTQGWTYSKTRDVGVGQSEVRTSAQAFDRDRDAEFSPNFILHILAGISNANRA